MITTFWIVVVGVLYLLLMRKIGLLERKVNKAQMSIDMIEETADERRKSKTDTSIKGPDSHRS